MHLQIQFQTCLYRRSRGHNHRLQVEAASLQVERERVDRSGPGSDVPMEVSQAVTTKSHAPVEEHDESLLLRRQRSDPRRTAGQVWDHQTRSYRHLLRCQQKRIALGFSVSSSSRDVQGDVVMSEVPTPLEEVQPPPPPAEPPFLLKTSSETDAMMLAAIRAAMRNLWRSAGQSMNQSSEMASTSRKSLWKTFPLKKW